MAFLKMQMEDLLYRKNLHQPLWGEKTRIDEARSLGIVRLASPRCDCLTLVDSVTFNIANEKTTVELMRVMSNMYEKPH